MRADATHAYHPLWVTGRPGGKPDVAPVYRVLVEKRFYRKWLELPDRVGLESACQFWDHIAMTPGQVPLINGSCLLRGRAGAPQAEGWSRTVHYEVSSMCRVNYQFKDDYRTRPDGDPHKVVAILTINYSSH